MRTILRDSGGDAVEVRLRNTHPTLLVAQDATDDLLTEILKTLAKIRRQLESRK